MLLTLMIRIRAIHSHGSCSTNLTRGVAVVIPPARSGSDEGQKSLQFNSMRCSNQISVTGRYHILLTDRNLWVAIEIKSAACWNSDVEKTCQHAGFQITVVDVADSREEKDETNSLWAQSTHFITDSSVFKLNTCCVSFLHLSMCFGLF